MSGFTLFGRPARIVIEMETELGNRVQVPIDASVHTHAGTPYGEVRLPFTGRWLESVGTAFDDHTMVSGDA